MPQQSFREGSSGPWSARLPSLKPPPGGAAANVNRRAQDIVAKHMYAQSSATLQKPAPLLGQISKTTPRAARSHDISHRQDKPANLAPRLPQSLIAPSDHVYEVSFLPKDASSVFRDEDGLWHTRVFPSNTPSSRTDAVQLDAWINKSLRRYEQADFESSVEELLPVLSTGLHEVVRQVMHHCTERGTSLQKIWATYVRLFDRVLMQLRQLVHSERQSTAKVHDELTSVREETRSLRKMHPEELRQVISDLEESFMKQQAELEDQLKKAREENGCLKNELRTTYRELEAWYPGFTLYQHSALKHHFSSRSGGRLAGAFSESPAPGGAGASTSASTAVPGGKAATQQQAESPESAIAEDFKRLLAMLPPEKRKRIGQELSLVMESVAVKESGRGQEVEQKEMFYLQKEVDAQEERIRELREEILRLETEQEVSTPLSPLSPTSPMSPCSLPHRFEEAPPADGRH